MTNWLNYHHLFYFYTIAHEGSIAKASRRLHLGQPTLSTQLKQLESALGHQLFERSNRSLKLTDTGRTVLEYANEIFRMGREMVDAVNDQLAPKRTQLQIGALDSVPKNLVHSLVVSAYEADDCFVSIVEGSDDYLLRELKAHRVDLVLSNTPAPVAPRAQFFSRRVDEMPVVVCASKKFAKLKLRFPQSLEGQPLMLPAPDTKLRADVEHYFETLKIRPQFIGEAQNNSVQNFLALSGHALVTVALPAVRDQLRDGSLVQIGELEGVREPLWLTAANRRVESGVVGRLMKSFRVN